MNITFKRINIFWCNGCSNVQQWYWNLFPWYDENYWFFSSYYKKKVVCVHKDIFRIEEFNFAYLFDQMQPKFFFFPSISNFIKFFYTFSIVNIYFPSCFLYSEKFCKKKSIFDLTENFSPKDLVVLVKSNFLGRQYVILVLSIFLRVLNFLHLVKSLCYIWGILSYCTNFIRETW